MRVLTDMELGSVVGGHDTAAHVQAASDFCARNATGVLEVTHDGREVRATVAGSGITIGGGSTTLVVDCSGQGRTNQKNDDKEKKDG